MSIMVSSLCLKQNLEVVSPKKPKQAVMPHTWHLPFCIVYCEDMYYYAGCWCNVYNVMLRCCDAAGEWKSLLWWVITQLCFLVYRLFVYRCTTLFTSSV